MEEELMAFIEGTRKRLGAHFEDWKHDKNVSTWPTVSPNHKKNIQISQLTLVFNLGLEGARPKCTFLNLYCKVKWFNHLTTKGGTPTPLFLGPFCVFCGCGLYY